MVVTDKMKVAFGVGVLLLVVAVSYLYLNANNRQFQAPSFLSIEGKVTSVNPDKLEIVIESSSVAKTIKVNQSTKIIKEIVQKDASGIVERRMFEEKNIEELQNGETVKVQYMSEENNVFSGVVGVTFTVEGDIDEYNKQIVPMMKAAPSAYLKVQAVSVDLENKKLEYKPYIINTISTTTMNIAFTDTIPVYKIDSAKRVSIVHARTPATLNDIKPDDTLFLMVDNKLLRAGRIVLQAFIIIGI